MTSPFSAPAARRHLHSRNIVCEGYLREDGLWDIEASLLDTKHYAFFHKARQCDVAPGEPIHGIWVRVTADDSLLIKAVEVKIEHGVLDICPAIEPAFQSVVGLVMEPGFTKEVRRRVGGRKGCLHVVELLGSIATTAFQTVFTYQNTEGDVEERPRFIDTCHAMAADGPAVRRMWPQWAEYPEAAD